MQEQERGLGFGEEDVLRGAPWPAAGGWGSQQGPAGRAPVHLGPVDLVQQAAAASETGVADDKPRGVFGDAFEEWAVPRADADPRKDRTEGMPSTAGRGVVDGAQAFADMYGGNSGGAVGGGLAAVVPGGARDSRAANDETAETVEVPKPLSDDEDDRTAEQESLPGLARQPRQIELAVDEPAYLLPEAAVLRKSAALPTGKGSDERDVAAVLIEALSQFGVEARMIGMVVGPRVTRYELQLAPGTKVGKVSALRDDLAYALASTEIRILAPIPGKSAVGVEVPNQRPDFVTLGDIYGSSPSRRAL